jgi:hypothetical protein
MHGGIGMTDEFDIGLFIKRARVDSVLFGDVAFHADRVATMRGYLGEGRRGCRRANRGIAVSKAVVRPKCWRAPGKNDLLEIVSKPRSGGQGPPPCHGSRKPNFPY